MLLKSLFISVFALFCFELSAQQYGFEVFSLEEGLPQSGVYDMLQDQHGFLWIGTEGGGVARFDGFHFDVWDKDSGLSDDAVRCLFEDSSGRIWAGTQEGGISIFSDDSIQIVDPSSGFPAKHVRTIFQDKHDRMWVGTFGDGLFLLDQEGKILEHEFEVPSPHVRCGLKDASDRLWVGTDAGLYCFTDSTARYFTEADGLRNQKILSCFEDQQHIWLGTESGVFVVSGDSLIEFASETLGKKRIRSLVKDGFGQFWFGTKEGVYRCEVDPLLQPTSPLEFISKGNGLSNERVRKLLVDDHNAVWVGTYFGGICRLSNQNFQYFNKEQSFPESNVTAIYEDHEGWIWIGTYDGSVYRYDGVETTKERVCPLDRTDDSVLDFEEVAPGLIWSCTRSGVLEAYKKGHFQGKIDAGQSLAITSITLFQGAPLLCTREGPLIWKGKRWGDGEISGASICAEELEASSLLVGTEKGLVLVENMEVGHETTFTPIAPSHPVAVRCMETDAQGNVWCGTQSKGLLRYRRGKVRKFNNRSYLSSEQVDFLKIDPQQNIWVGSKKGLDYLELSPDQSFVLDHQYFGPEEGFKGGESNWGAAFIDASNKLWMGTVRGVVRHSEHKISPPPHAPKLEITAVNLHDSLTDWSKYDVLWEGQKRLPLHADLSHSDNHLTIHFRGIDISSLQKVSYQYMLEGHDETWGEIVHTTHHEYGNLPSGTYTFLVRSRSAQGIWNENPATFSFTINPPFYLTAWFLIGAALGLWGLVYLFIRIRLQYLKAEKALLELKVQERTDQLYTEKQKSEELLLNILPKEIADELIESGSADARDYDEVSVLFSDFKGFTKLSENLPAHELVAHLDAYFRAYDQLTEEFGIEKIKTIGDAYMCVAGLPRTDGKHAYRIIQFALAMLRVTQELNEKNRAVGKPIWQLRIGINSGPVVAGVVGKKKFAFDIWGDTVNLASRMESSGEIDHINVSAKTYSLTKEYFIFDYRGKIAAKNKGELEMYFVKSPVDA